MGALLNTRKVMGTFDYRNLLSIDQVVASCGRYYVSVAEIKKLCEQKLIIATIKGGKKYFPGFTPDRVLFIKILQKKFNYPLPYLQQIIACEDRVISGAVDPFLIELSRINKKKMKFIFSEEDIRRFRPFKYRSPIVNGYSPQVEFNNYDVAKKLREINWEKTNKKICELDFVEFFSTPDYFLGIDKGKISICIRNPRDVEATAMRMLSKLYTVFRRRLVNGSKRWGINSGRRDRIIQRDENIRRIYKQLREKNPRAAVENYYDKLIEYAASVGLPVSRERINRILYAKTPAGNGAMLFLVEIFQDSPKFSSSTEPLSSTILN